MIYHITTRTEWQQAQTNGAYTAPSLQTEGFIHCSTDAQIVDVANAFYRDVPGLVLLCIQPDALNAEIRWEPPVHPEAHSSPAAIDDSKLFPHIYGAINLEAVKHVVNFPKSSADVYTLPADLPR